MDPPSKAIERLPLIPNTCASPKFLLGYLTIDGRLNRFRHPASQIELHS